jgi:glycosyltransferase involved in cell wall biosynthesis/uncharacterized membrane protein
MNKKLVTVIIPTRNRRNFLEKSLKSVLNQTYKNIEVIVINDASVDDTLEFLKKQQDLRLKVFSLKKQSGAQVARNKGLAEARGEFISFNDDDDIWKKDKLEKQIKAFDKNIDLVYCQIKRDDKENSFYLPSKKKALRKESLKKTLFLGEHGIGLPSVVIKRSSIKLKNLFDENLPRYQDWELFLRLVKNLNFKYLPEVLVFSKVLKNGITKNEKILLKATKLIFKKHKKEIAKDREVLSNWLFRIGDLYYHKRNYKKARNYFKKAFFSFPLKKYKRAIIKTYMKKDISEFLIKLKEKVLNNKVILLILIFGFILRTIGINQSFWLDEVVQAMTSADTFKNLFLELTGDFHPPFYHIFMWLWAKIFENKEIAMRLPSLILGSLTIVVVYKIGLFLKKELKLKNLKCFPIIAALFMATAPFHIYYSQEARNYAVTCFLASLSILFFLPIFSFQKKDKRQILKYVVLTVVFLYTNYFAVFVVLAQNLAMILKYKSIKSLKSWIFIQTLLLIFFSPVFLLLSKQLTLGRGATSVLPEWEKLVNASFFKALPLTFAKFLIGRITIFNKKLYAFLVGFLFISYSIVFLKGYLKEKTNFFQKQSSVIFIWFFVPLSLAFLTSFFIPNFQPFRLLLILPAFYLILSFGISFFKKKIKIILISLVLFVNLASSFVYLTNPYFKREDWRGLANYLDKQKNIAVVFPSNTSNWPYRYYSTSQNNSLFSTSEGFEQTTKENAEALLTSLEENKIYYIRYLVPMFDPNEIFLKALEENNFEKTREISFNQLLIWEFSKN